jgi:iron complex transport system substrate-binding protein
VAAIVYSRRPARRRPSPHLHRDALDRRGFLVGGAAASALWLSGCASDDPGPAAGAGDEDETHQVDDAFGTTTIPVHPERIIADSVSTLAHLTALQVVPVGAAIPVDISPDYLGPEAASVPNVVADDGWTINVEAALALQPDLVLAVGADYNKKNCKRYQAAMATYAYVERWLADVEAIKEDFRAIAAAIGRDDEAEEAIEVFDAKVDQTRVMVEEAGVTDIPVGVVRFDASGFIGIRTGELSNVILDAVGLAQPQWPEPDLSGYVELSMENLDLLERAEILMVCTDDNVVVEEMDVFDSPLWNNLAPVAGGRAYFVGAWNGADILQLGLIADAVQEHIVG